MYRISPQHTPIFLIAILPLILISGIISISIGIIDTPVSDVFIVIWSHIIGTPSGIDNDTIIWHIRTPRTILAGIVGAGLSIVGVILQSVMRNPLADPHLFGISSGSALGAVIVIIWIGGGIYSISIGAFIGACVAMMCVLSIAYTSKKGVSPERLLLSGVAVSFLLIALTNFVIFQGENNSATSVLFWMLGGMGMARWDMIGLPLIVIILCIPYIILHGRNLNAIMAGDETALTLGVDASRIRLYLFLLSALITGVCVAISGAIGFVGLMIPHICRYFTGANNRILILACAGLGSIFLIWADAFSRILFAPQELPIGIFTAFVGGLFFIMLMLKNS